MAAFTARVYSPEIGNTDTGLWLSDGTGIQLIAREGVEDATGPGLEPGTTFGNVDMFPFMQLSPDGRLVFRSLLQGPAVGSTNNYTSWEVAGGTRALQARYGASGSLGPGYPAGAVFRQFDYLDVASNGQTVFSGGTDTPIEGTYASADGIWRMVNGAPEVIAYCGSTGWPGLLNTADYWFTDVANLSQGGKSLAVNASGDACFIAQLREFSPTITPTNNGGIWWVPASTYTNRLVAGKGIDNEFGPGLGPGVRFLGFDALVLGDDGTLLFDGVLRSGEGGVGSTNNNGLWKWHPANTVPVPIAREGTEGALGPNLGAGVTFSLFDDWMINSGGTLLLGARLSGSGITSTNNSGLWFHEGGGWRAIALAGTDGIPGPGLGTGVFFSDVRRAASLNQRGTVVFEGTLKGSGVNSSNNRGVWIHRDGTNQLVLRSLQEIDVDPSEGTLLRSVMDIFTVCDLGGQYMDQQAHTEDDRIIMKLTFWNTTDQAVIQMSTLPPGLEGRISREGGLPVIRWDGDPARGYEVHYKNNLTDALWTPLDAVVQWNGSQAAVTDTNASPATGRFYQILQLP